MSERKQIQEKVEKLAEADGQFFRRVSWTGKRRAPDNVFVKDGRTVWIEFKDRGKAARSDQDTEHQEMIEAGAEVYVVDSIWRACEILGIPWKRDPLRPHQ